MTDVERHQRFWRLNNWWASVFSQRWIIPHVCHHNSLTGSHQTPDVAELHCDYRLHPIQHSIKLTYAHVFKEKKNGENTSEVYLFNGNAAQDIHSHWAGHTFAFNDSTQLPPAGETFLEIAFSSQSAFKLWSPVWRMQTRQRFVLVWWTRSENLSQMKTIWSNPFYFFSSEEKIPQCISKSNIAFLLYVVNKNEHT